MELTLLNRGTDTTRPPIEGAESIVGDAGRPGSIRRAVGAASSTSSRTSAPSPRIRSRPMSNSSRGRTGQYIFISSASAYQKPVAHLPIVESTPLHNPFWQYSRDKIACEDVLVAAYRATSFPMTIVRPSHTYDSTLIPLRAGGRRSPASATDGPSSSTATAPRSGRSPMPATSPRAFVGLFGNPHALGSPVHITSDESLTWNAIAGLFAAPSESSRTSCTCRVTPSRASCRRSATGCSATRRTRWSSTTPASSPSCPAGWRRRRSPRGPRDRRVVPGRRRRQVPDAALDAAFDSLAQRFG